MSDYLFIQSQDPFTETRVTGQYELAVRLAKAGNNVRVLLVQNGVAPARKGAKCPSFVALQNSSVSVLVDTFSLNQREIDIAQLKEGIQPGELGIVIDAMLSRHKVIWN